MGVSRILLTVFFLGSIWPAAAANPRGHCSLGRRHLGRPRCYPYPLPRARHVRLCHDLGGLRPPAPNAPARSSRSSRRLVQEEPAPLSHCALNSTPRLATTILNSATRRPSRSTNARSSLTRTMKRNITTKLYCGEVSFTKRAPPFW
jgi:hypothetical protein